MKKFTQSSPLFLIGFGIILLTFVFLAGCGKETEIKEEQPPVTEMKKPAVTGIREFHEVLYPVWHDYFPQGDFQSIREAIPEFKRTTKILMEAELPEFYHNVKDHFQDGRKALALSVDKLESVAQTGNDQELATAVEEMHTAFERMARILAPRIKELEEFHLVLYPLWHQAMPNEDYQAIKSAIPSLEDKTDALASAVLPQRFKDLEPQFLEKREALNQAVHELADVCRKNDDDSIIQKLTQMHQAYMELDQVFE